MSCSENFIGIRCLCDGASEEKSKSGLYIENLEGIDIKNVADVTTGKFENAKDLIQNKIDFAIESVFSDLHSELHPYLTLHSAIEIASIGDFESEYNLDNEGQKGLKITKHKSKLSDLIIEKVVLSFKEDVEDEELFIIDGEHEEVIEFSATAGTRHEIELNYTAKTDEVIIFTDMSLQLLKGDIGNCHQLSNCDACGSGGDYEHLTAVNYDFGSGSETSYFNGIQAHCQVVCSIDKIRCSLLHTLKMPILYKSGILILQEWESTDRLNFLAIYSDEWVEKKLVEWIDYTYPNELEKVSRSLIHLLKGFDKACVQCNGAKYVIGL